MNVGVRPFRLEDIRNVAEIERQAFPTLWPPTPFKRELENRLAKYLVAWELRGSRGSHGEEARAEEVVAPAGRSLVGRLWGAIRGQPPSDRLPDQPDSNLKGFVGLWFMSGEAHITAIAVEDASRGKGIGELLLIGSIEMAMDQRATVMSLEARVSNYVAQSLYQKYGFMKVGIRKGYYTDNREDAVIMTTEPISTPEYQERYRELKEAYRRKHGPISVALA